MSLDNNRQAKIQHKIATNSINVRRMMRGSRVRTFTCVRCFLDVVLDLGTMVALKIGSSNEAASAKPVDILVATDLGSNIVVALAIGLCDGRCILVLVVASLLCENRKYTQNTCIKNE